MNIAVLVKQVPDPEALVSISNDGTKLEIEQKFTMNLFDEFALEEALRVKAKHTGKVKIISLGTNKAIETLRTGIAMGADEAVLLEDALFSECDCYMTALALSRAVGKEPFDLILCGKQAIDDDSGEVGQMVAQFLNLPHVGGIVRLDIGDGTATAEVPVEGGKEIVEVQLPALFTAQKGLNEPRVPLITGVMKAMKTEIPKLTAEDLGLSLSGTNQEGPRIRIAGYSQPKKRPKAQIIPGEPREAAVEAVRILMEVERVI
jgi:electron transfer flavoprotein beta subunit